MPSDRSALHEQAQALLDRAEATAAAEWHITESEHAAMMELAETFGIELPLATFRSMEGTTTFARLAVEALQD